MPIPYTTDSLEKIPEIYRALYTEKNDQGETVWIATGMSGVVPRDVHEKFRDNNVALKEQIENLSAVNSKWAEIGDDPDQVKSENLRAKEVLEKLDNKDLIEAENFKNALETKTQAMKDELSGKVAAMERRALEAESKAKQAEESLRQFRLDTEIQSASIDVGVKAKAMVDVRGRALLAGWTLNEQGQPVLRNKSGLVEHGSDGYPLTLREWMRGPLYEEAEHIFEKGTGGGAPGSMSNSNKGLEKYGNVNPFDPKTKNFTIQSQIATENPQLAQQLARQAGVRYPFS